MPFLFDIKRYSINDGPGVRVTVFFKGCPLSCRWCHNPESISFKTEKLYDKSKCIGCGSCVAVCPENALTLTKTSGVVTDSGECVLCGKCAEVCPTKAIEMSGRDYSEDEVMTAVLKETHIMDASGGGVTFSGGEPLMYPEALKSLLIRCGMEGIHRAIDTSGCVKSPVVEDILPHADLFLYDLKLMNAQNHRKWVGVDNTLILKNLALISDHDKEYHIRIPLVEGVNTDDENIIKTIDFLNGLKRKPTVVGLLPYHNIASKKYEKLGKTYNGNGMAEPSKERMTQILSVFTANGLNAVIGG
ncbi:glycyl-radical enzyme activating protein [Proteiniphilum sp. X52]|uniref:glycyl-radical enzyme activating protein n=1 Tax=Proteiniphilum sp. X52 TaxID=2382159 RepID=UPI000F09AD56|nr:glycyl-radical enzyme activating protein [Proteiniphilum sp. X52]RNC64116.1 glycyl-radical enzyme activating protein [Proteiniphilum sp. X52]